MDTNYLTLPDIASILKISTEQVYDLLAKELFPFTRYHRRVIVKVDDLMKFMGASNNLNHPNDDLMSIAAKSAQECWSLNRSERSR